MRPKLLIDDRGNRRRVYRYSANPSLQLYLTELEPGGRVPLHRHTDLVEILDVLEGERVLTVGEERKVVRPGDTEIVPANALQGIVDPQEGVEDGPFRSRTTLIYSGPAVSIQDLGVRRIVAVGRDSAGRIEIVRYDNGSVKSIEDAVEDADRGLVQGVHAVRPRQGRPYLRVHRILNDTISLEDLPSIEEWEVHLRRG